MNECSDANSVRLSIIKILVYYDEPVGLKKIARRAELSLGKALGTLQGLVKKGFVKRIEKNYLITEKGQIASKILDSVPSGGEFKFYLGIDRFTGIEANSIESFIDRIKTVRLESLEFHLLRNDFGTWIVEFFKDKELAKKLEIKDSELKSENLRTALLLVIEERYGDFAKLKE